ncbi:MAG: hypothetical protein ACLQDA_16455 [Terracidiphilus sp.]
MAVTYVFGAGASCDIGYPLASGMGEQLFDYMLASDDPSSRRYAGYLIERFGKSTNFEDLITELLQQTAELKGSPNSEDKAERMRLGNSRGRLVDCLRLWFREIHDRPAPLYAEFSQRIVNPGDTVITFNYDDSLERELKRAGKWDVGRGYGFPLSAEDDPSDVSVLKLHGSINWLVSVFGGATGGTFLVNPRTSMGNHPVIHQADLEFLGYRDFSGHTYRSGGAFPCLILPGRNKQFFFDTSFGHEYSDFWEHLWRQADRSLGGSEKIVVCGYSLLPVDEQACDLLLNTPPKHARVEIVSGNQTERIATDFRRAGFSDVSGCPGEYFRDWLEAQ